MDNPKTPLVKSKSSNSTSEAKKNTQKNEKISRSSAEFQPRTTFCTGVQPLMLRKRGVYVEKKPIKISINNSEQSPDVPPNQPIINPPRPIPRPSKKRFLNSVLSILSKSTAGTQCPEYTEDTKKIDKTINKLKMRKDEEDIREEWTTSPNISKKKHKYRSRILNNQANRDSVTVLQSKKDIATTSSNISGYMNVKNDASTVDPETVKWAETWSPFNTPNASIVSVASNAKKVRLTEKDCEPSTIVAQIPKTNDKTNDKSFYDFFVDMLQTTMSVYNMETEFNNPPLLTSGNSSKVTLEINESVASRFHPRKFEKRESETFDVSRKVSSLHAYSIMPDERDEWSNRQMLEHFQSQLHSKKSPTASARRRRKLKSDSFKYKRTSPLPKTTSLPIPSKKKTSKKDAEKEFFNLLKEELEMKSNDVSFDEPENFYEALKVIARNKRLSEEWKTEIPSDPEDHVCHFKPRRVLSRKSSGKEYSSYPERLFTRNPSMTGYKKRKTIKEKYEDDTTYSNHSLEVVGYDYEMVKPKRRPKKGSMSFTTSPPSPPADDFWRDCSDSDTSANMMAQRQYVLDKLGRL